MDAKAAETGHFRLVVERRGRTEVLDFSGGQTEAWLAPPAGEYQLRLDYVDNTSQAVTASARPARVVTESAGQSAPVQR